MNPLGFTRLSVDSIFMMPHLGVLSTINERAATDVFVRDCMVISAPAWRRSGRARTEIGAPRMRLRSQAAGLRKGRSGLANSRYFHWLPMSVPR